VQVRPANVRLIQVVAYYVRLGTLVKFMHGTDRLGKVRSREVMLDVFMSGSAWLVQVSPG
jgi:hypothetical protein